jgi:protein-S-isoprenylcysteine O-methyltransferase Ste14
VTEEATVWILTRAVTYATLFIGFLLVFLPVRIVSWSGIRSIPVAGLPQILGMFIAAVGLAIAVWCILTFVFRGQGTPAPFDPPRRLVVRGPYRIVRNPMYIGAVLTLMGAVLVYESIALLVYAMFFLVITHVFVIAYEEPTLRRTFGDDYDAYCAHVGRWWPKM